MQEGPISLRTSLNVENIPGVIRVRGDGGGKSDKCYFADLEEGEGTLSPLIQTASRSWRRQGDRFFPRASERNAAPLTP